MWSSSFSEALFQQRGCGIPLVGSLSYRNTGEEATKRIPCFLSYSSYSVCLPGWTARRWKLYWTSASEQFRSSPRWLRRRGKTTAAAEVRHKMVLFSVFNIREMDGDLGQGGVDLCCWLSLCLWLMRSGAVLQSHHTHAVTCFYQIKGNFWIWRYLYDIVMLRTQVKIIYKYRMQIYFIIVQE